MIDERFSSEAFLDAGLNSDKANRMAETLAEEIQNEMHQVVLPKFLEIIERLNAMGHNLKPYDTIEPGDISFRDDTEDETGYHCRLRVAIDTVISTGYSRTFSEGEADEEVKKLLGNSDP